MHACETLHIYIYTREYGCVTPPLSFQAPCACTCNTCSPYCACSLPHRPRQNTAHTEECQCEIVKQIVFGSTSFSCFFHSHTLATILATISSSLISGLTYRHRMGNEFFRGHETCNSVSSQQLHLPKRQDVARRVLLAVGCNRLADDDIPHTSAVAARNARNPL